LFYGLEGEAVKQASTSSMHPEVEGLLKTFLFKEKRRGKLSLELEE